jgi:zinc transporter
MSARSATCSGTCPTFRSTAELLAHLLRDQADVTVQIVRDSTGRVNSIEDGLLANRVGSSRAKLGALRGCWCACGGC